MRMLKLLVLAFAAALAAGCVYDYGVGKDFPHLEKSLIVIEGDIIAGGISEVRVSATSKMETTRYASTKAEDYVLREPLCQVWVESAEGEVWPGKDTTYVWGFENYFDRRLLRISYTVDTRDLPVDGEYRLCVSYPDRGEYRSKFKKVLKAPQVESFDFVFAPDTSYINVMLTSRGDNDGARFCRIEYEEWWENRPPLMPNVILYPSRYDLTTLSQPYKDSLYKCFDKFASQKILLEEGIANADAFVALTKHDEENMVLSLFASNFDNAKVITKINRFEYEDIIKHLKLDTTIYPNSITSDVIVRYVRAMKNVLGSNVETMYNIIKDKVEASEFFVREGSPIIGTPLVDLKFKNDVLIAAIIRGKTVTIPRGGDSIKAGDSVIVVSKLTALRDISDVLETKS